MSAFGGLILTNRGRNLQAKAQAGTTLNFTRVAIGDGQLEGSSILDLTALKNEKVSLAINKLKVLTGGKAVVGAVFSNQGLVSGFYWRELGLFAQDPDLGEILYCYGNAGANAEYIPADGGPDIVEKNIDVVSIVGNASSVTATIDQSLIFATQQDVDDTISSHLTDYVRQPGYGVTTGSANTYAVTLSPAPAAYTAGMGITVKINVANTGASTLNINGLGAKPILDSKGNAMSSGKLRLSGVYTLRYDGTNFILQGEGASGNATASDLLSGKTASTDAGDIVGTMPIAQEDALSIYTTEGMPQRIDLYDGFLDVYNTFQGYITTGFYRRIISNLSAANIKKGITISDGVGAELTGTFTEDATAVAGEILSGETAYVNGAKVTGTMPNRSGVEIGANFNYTTAGVVRLTPPVGYYDGAAATRVALAAADLQPANILTGKNILGVAGTLVQGKQFASGIVASDASRVITVGGLAFRPRMVVLIENPTSGNGEGTIIVIKDFTNTMRATGVTHNYFSIVTGLYLNAFTGGYYTTNAINNNGFSISDNENIGSSTIRASTNFEWYAYGA